MIGTPTCMRTLITVSISPFMFDWAWAIAQTIDTTTQPTNWYQVATPILAALVGACLGYYVADKGRKRDILYKERFKSFEEIVDTLYTLRNSLRKFSNKALEVPMKIINPKSLRVGEDPVEDYKQAFLSVKVSLDSLENLGKPFILMPREIEISVQELAGDVSNLVTRLSGPRASQLPPMTTEADIILKILKSGDETMKIKDETDGLIEKIENVIQNSFLFMKLPESKQFRRHSSR